MSRINLYAEEITHDIEVIERTAASGKPYWGLRIYLRSPSQLQPAGDEDDRSAVTFWFDAEAALNDFRNALYTASRQRS